MPASPWELIKNMSLRCTVKINGANLKDEYGIESISISHEIGVISAAELSISGKYSADFSDLSVADDEAFTPGASIEITGGYDDKGETILFKGLIVSHSIQLSGEQPVALKLSCKHEAVKMTLEKKTKVFEGKKDSEIISGILVENKITGYTVASTGITNPKFTQNAASDWDIILSRAEENGLVVCLDETTLTIDAPKVSETPVLRLASGDSILDFTGELIAENQPTVVEAYGWDKKQSLLKVTAEEPSINAQGNLQAKALAEKYGRLKQIFVVPRRTKALSQ
jgi:phage protein D